MARRRSFGQVRRLPSKRWQAFYTGPDTALHYAPSTFDTKLDAEAWLVDERRIIASGTWAAPAERAHAVHSVTLANYAEAWLADRTLRPRTRELYRALLDRRILPTLGDNMLNTITPVTVRTWHAGMGQRTPTATAHAYALLKTILGTAVDDELITQNPCRIRSGAAKKRAHKVEPLTLPQLAALAAAMPEQHRLAVLLAAWCALRFGEVTELRRSDIDLKNGRIRIRRAVVRVAGKAVVGAPKTDAGVRDVSLPPHLLPLVKEHLAKHCELGRDGLLFPAKGGGQLTPSSLYGRPPGRRDGQTGRRLAPWGFYAARVDAGVPDLHFHDLRHCGAVLAAQTGATVAELMGRLGHTTSTMAMHYQHVAQGRDAEIARRLSAMVES
jgi:integrase